MHPLQDLTPRWIVLMELFGMADHAYSMSPVMGTRQTSICGSASAG